MNKIVLIIIAILLPPLAAYLQVGVSKHLWINIILCFLFFVPGVLHALWLVLGDHKS
jgi:uncharacterized membrane protein YqaE (UPF0057 family)